MQKTEKKVCKDCKKVLDAFDMGMWDTTRCHACDIKEYMRQCQLNRANGWGW